MCSEENDLYMSEKFWCDFWLNNGKWINPTMKYLECKAAYRPNPINEIETNILKDNDAW
jgi:hypothetical protein